MNYVIPPSNCSSTRMVLAMKIDTPLNKEIKSNHLEPVDKQSDDPYVNNHTLEGGEFPWRNGKSAVGRDIVEANSNLNHAITITSELIPSGKIWLPFPAFD